MRLPTDNCMRTMRGRSRCPSQAVVKDDYCGASQKFRMSITISLAIKPSFQAGGYGGLAADTQTHTIIHITAYPIWGLTWAGCVYIRDIRLSLAAYPVSLTPSLL